MFHLLLLSTLLACGQGFEFQTSTQKIHPRLTHTMVARCDLNGSLPSQLYASSPLDSKSADQVTHVTAITISRNGSDVGTVTKFDPAKAILDLEVIGHVSGSVTGVVGENSYLELVWQYPTDQQAGNYTCEVSAITDHGHCVSFSRSVFIQYIPAPSIDDLVTHIYDQQKTIARMSEIVKELKTSSSKSTKTGIQQGKIQLDSSTNWGSSTRTSRMKRQERAVSFGKPYSSAPIVSLSLSHIEANQRDQKLQFWLKLVSVNETGFIMACENYHYYDDNYKISSMTVDWTSFPTELK